MRPGHPSFDNKDDTVFKPVEPVAIELSTLSLMYQSISVYSLLRELSVSEINLQCNSESHHGQNSEWSEKRGQNLDAQLSLNSTISRPTPTLQTQLGANL